LFFFVLLVPFAQLAPMGTLWDLLFSNAYLWIN